MPEEKRIQVRVVIWQVQQVCECGHSMIYTGETFRSHSSLYPHVCLNCGRKENFDKTYPYHVREGI